VPIFDRGRAYKELVELVQRASVRNKLTVKLLNTDVQCVINFIFKVRKGQKSLVASKKGNQKIALQKLAKFIS
jgi:hypothetical protein